MAKKYRDGLFRDYFSDKRRLLGLCNLLTGEDATDPDEIKINTLDGVFFGRLKNDISCLFRGKILVIIEHQATINENMPLRMLFYVAELLRQYVQEWQKDIYLGKLLSLPEPKFFVFYNGRKKEVERREMRLSSAFGKPTALEVVVQVYNLNENMNEDFILRDVDLTNYCIFVNLVNKFMKSGLDLNHAIAEAFDYCIKHGIMTGYLLERKKELASMLALEYNPELDRQAWIEQGIEIGFERGIELRNVKVAKNLLAMNFPINDIMKATGCTEEQILKLAEK